MVLAGANTKGSLFQTLVNEKIQPTERRFKSRVAIATQLTPLPTTNYRDER